MKFGEMKDKSYKVFHVNRRMNKILVVYKSSQVVQPILLKFKHISIIDNKDIKIIFSIVSSHPCLSDAELYINMQPIENTKLISDRDDNEVFDWEKRMTTQVTKHFVFFNPYITDNILVNTNLRDIDKQHAIVDSDVPENIIKQASLYTLVDNTIYVDNYFFEKNVKNEDDMKVDGQQANTSHDVESLQDTKFFL